MMARTPGEVELQGHLTGYGDTEGTRIIAVSGEDVVGLAIGDTASLWEQRDANATTWAIAHTAANKIDAMGFDGDKALEILPKFVEDWQSNERVPTGGHHDANLALHIASEFMQAISEKDDV